MKNQLLTLIIGILIGSIITTGVFLIIKSNEKSNMPSFDSSKIRSRENFDMSNFNNMMGENNEKSKEE